MRTSYVHYISKLLYKKRHLKTIGVRVNTYQQSEVNIL